MIPVKAKKRSWFRALGAVLPGVLIICLTAGALSVARAGDDLEDLLRQVGEEYAVAYSSPFLYAFGPALNSGLYQTASIPHTGLTFGVSIKAMATRIDDGDQNFRRELDDIDLGLFDPAFAGQTGTVVMAGPTIFGDTDTDGTITGYLDGVQVFQNTTIPGLVDTKFVPMATPEFYLGGIAGFKVIARWLPSMDIGDYGEFKYFGYGAQWNTAALLKNLPFDLMVGFSDQKLEIGDLLETNATAYYAAVSRDFALLTLYAGAAIEDSDMTVSYDYNYVSGDMPMIGHVSFTVDGEQESRMTLGATLNLGLKINAEVARGDMTTFAAGVTMGF